jgi:simple sugar transport system ATP-binding protein
VITLTGIGKRFSGVSALDGVSLRLAPGRVHGLLGENGAGKSTLMNVLFGLVQPDTGSIAVDGKVVRIRSPRAAQRLGIGMVHQHFKLVPGASVVDNLALALGTGLGRIDRAAWGADIRRRAAELRWDLDPAASVSALAVGQQQRVEILKALLAIEAGGGARTLILDEPTAVLTPQEIDDLLPALRTLAASGVAVVFISHKLGEIARVCDEVSVLRRGRLVHHGPADEAPGRFAELMVGRPVATPVRRPRPAAAEAPVRLRFTGVSVRPSDGPALLEGVDFALAAGEIVGIAGVEGNGQASLVQVALGLLEPQRGTRWSAEPARRFAVIPDDRQREALVLPLSLRDNLLLKRYREPPFSRHGWLSPAAWDRHARALMAAFDVRAGGTGAAVATLSGGNQQKAVIARELEASPAVIVAVNPTRGLDIAAATAVLERLVAARDGGAAVLLVHSDLDELLAVSDRVLVLHGGRLDDSGWPAADRAAIGRLMLGAPAVTP